MSITAFTLGTTPFSQYSIASGNSISDNISIEKISGYSVQINWSGASNTTATVEVQASNDGINFITIDTTTLDVASDDKLLNVERAMYRFIRINFTQNSETTGTLNVVLGGKY